MFDAPVQWDIDAQITQAVTTEPAPPDCPGERQFVPSALRATLLEAAHSSLGTGTGFQQTISLLQNKYWWPCMSQELRHFVKGCPECAIAKSPHHLPAGKLLPLPVPKRPWSHLGVDFLTDLPASENHTCILVVADRFSKACKLIPLKQLPTALKTAEILFHHVFRNYGIPEDSLRSGTTINFPGMVEFYEISWFDCQSFFRIPPSVERAVGEENTGD